MMTAADELMEGFWKDYFRNPRFAPGLQPVAAPEVGKQQAPEYLQDLVPLDDCWGASRTTRMTGILDPYRLKHPKMSSVNANSKLRRRRISVFLPTVWNDLPFQIRSIPNVDTFKSQLKTHLFTVAFGEVPMVLV
eukprot:sb/3474740/